jgi:hypothetical protein
MVYIKPRGRPQLQDQQRKYPQEKFYVRRKGKIPYLSSLVVWGIQL